VTVDGRIAGVNVAKQLRGELVSFLVPARDAAALVEKEMEAAYELDVPLRADIGWGANWAEAVPAGH